jgi:hypothetical protein
VYDSDTQSLSSVALPVINDCLGSMCFGFVRRDCGTIRTADRISKGRDLFPHSHDKRYKHLTHFSRGRGRGVREARLWPICSTPDPITVNEYSKYATLVRTSLSFEAH